ncbi:uncharacterized protein LOC117123411 [Anneissia japonica]|uniref:uncharacterized protein LOC117123411 n=1 Tax=Anneissia japonica TaxID=1529436 RepID=UPI00142555EB|nr:uncharacterized protein LOC117123411 [Anneissia japonica]XP_033125207.1 uncharacterized protein LOC117123411 [Anneissia japonica]
MALLQYLFIVIYMYTIIKMAQPAQENILNIHGSLEIDGNRKMSLLDRRKRMDDCDFVCRCWNDVNGTILKSMLPDHCLYVNQNELQCYMLITLKSNNMEADQECTSYGYELADVNSALILDGIAEFVRSVITNRGRRLPQSYWLRVNSTLQDVSTAAGSCSTCEDFSPDDEGCTYLKIEEDKYRVREGRCRSDNDGLICQLKFELTRYIPTTPPVKILTHNEITTVKSSGVTSTRQSEQDVSKMSNVTLIGLAIALAVAVVCIAVLIILLLKRRTSTKGAPDVSATQVNQQSHDDKSSNLYPTYESSLPGDNVGLHHSDTAQKDNNPNYIVVEGDVYNNLKPETVLNDPSYDSLGPQYDTLNRQSEVSFNA